MRIGQQCLVKILPVHLNRHQYLPRVVEALRLPRFLARFGEDGEKNGGQDRDDRDDDE
ncbi:MAG: hypothetical protein BWY76_02746 [bacterium ADurb.Bin429]|nr:MAG: hypothetical protein BWY76_02746 [bacterium ADurb.Bin429]